MVKLDNLKDEKTKLVIEEVLKFRELVKGHLKLLTAIGKL